VPRIEPLEFNTATASERDTLGGIAKRYGHPTNMKRTLARSSVALRALMEWYPLHDAVKPVLGERLTALFCHAISAQSDCLICSTYFRRQLIDAGEDPEHVRLDDRDRAVVAFGRQLAADANGVDEALYENLAGYFSPAQIIELTAFAGLMIATNVFNNALRVDLDDDLHRYRLPRVAEGAGRG
jgi:alkylhydroperoxidase family enzyme